MKHHSLLSAQQKFHIHQRNEANMAINKISTPRTLTVTLYVAKMSLNLHVLYLQHNTQHTCMYIHMYVLTYIQLNMLNTLRTYNTLRTSAHPNYNVEKYVYVTAIVILRMYDSRQSVQYLIPCRMRFTRSLCSTHHQYC